MNKSESILTFEAALKESKELQEKFAAAKARIIENKDAATDVELLVKAAAQVGYTLDADELAHAIAQMQEVNEEELAKVAGGIKDSKQANNNMVVASTTTFDTLGCSGIFLSFLAL